jgi:hypothetical protein
MVIAAEGERNGNLIYAAGISLRERIPLRDTVKIEAGRKFLVGAHSEVEL